MKTNDFKNAMQVLNIDNRTGILLLLFLVMIFGCEKEEEEIYAGPIPEVNLYDDYRNLPTYSYSVSAEEIGRYLKDEGLDHLVSAIEYSVSVHRLEYATTYQGEEITASGLVIIPLDMDTPAQVLSFHHGTLFAEANVPSNFTGCSSWGFEIAPASGYITFIPDYIGYGVSSNILHPYLMYEPAVNAVIDLIKSGILFLNQNGIEYQNDGILLGGFSEGGYVTLAVQKEIESHPEHGLHIKASAPGAGPYDLELTADIILGQDTYPSPGYLGLIFSAYNQQYFNRTLTDYFQEEYADDIPDLLTGEFDQVYIDDFLPAGLHDLLNPAFLDDFRGSGEEQLKLKFQENSVANWVPQSPTRLIHGMDDELVPIEITQSTYDTFIANGASPQNIEVITFEGAHDGLKWWELAAAWFDQFKKL